MDEIQEHLMVPKYPNTKDFDTGIAHFIHCPNPIPPDVQGLHHCELQGEMLRCLSHCLYCIVTHAVQSFAEVVRAGTASKPVTLDLAPCSLLNDPAFIMGVLDSEMYSFLASPVEVDVRGAMTSVWVSRCVYTQFPQAPIGREHSQSNAVLGVPTHAAIQSKTWL